MGVLTAAALGVTAASAGPGPGGDDFDDPADVSDTIDDISDAPDLPDAPDEPDDTPDAPDEPDSDVAGAEDADSDDHSGSGGGDPDDSGGASDVDDDESGSGGGDDDDQGGSGSGGDDDDDDSSGGSGSGGGDDDDDDSSGSGSSGSGSGGGDDDEEDEEESNSGSGSSNSGSSNSGSGGEEYAANAQERAAQPLAIERDEHGEEYVAGEALLTGVAHDVELARQAGFVPISQNRLASLDREVVRLALPNGMSVQQAVTTLRTLAPDAIVSANHAYHSSQADIAAAPAPRRSQPSRFVGVLGIIDTGISADQLAQPEALLSQRTFAGRTPAPREHGQAVAALAASHGMRLHVADVFGPNAAGGEVASAESIAAALDWMVQSGVPVINISIEGPDNPILQALVLRANERGHVVVAAAGNGGPLARPAFPAAFEGAIAVTAIDANDRPYLRANRGRYIAFAAQGVNVAVDTGDGALSVSGTSFASPVVAAEIAARLAAPSPERAERVVDDLRRNADDLGEPGRDSIFGWGAVRR